MLRLWAVVLISNLLETFLFAGGGREESDPAGEPSNS